MDQKKIFNEIRDFAMNYFKKRDFFCYVYGSHAYGVYKDTSDVDVAIFSDVVSILDVNNCVKFIKELHNRYGMNLDFEIEYSNKLLKDYAFLEKAAKGEGFKNSNGQVFVPAIVKDKEYLNSYNFLLRFFLGSFVHKHIFLAGNADFYRRTRKLAEENLLKIILNSKNIEKISITQLVDNFIFNEGASGDFYLGFEDAPHHRFYLEGMTSSLLERMSSEEKILKTKDEKYEFKREYLIY